MPPKILETEELHFQNGIIQDAAHQEVSLKRDVPQFTIQADASINMQATAIGHSSHGFSLYHLLQLLGWDVIHCPQQQVVCACRIYMEFQAPVSYFSWDEQAAYIGN